MAWVVKSNMLTYHPHSDILNTHYHSNMMPSSLMGSWGKLVPEASFMTQKIFLMLQWESGTKGSLSAGTSINESSYGCLYKSLKAK